MPTTAVKGVDWVVEVNTGTDVAPVWTRVGGQRGGTLTLSTAAIDASSKDGDGFTENEVGFRSWSIESDGAYAEGDNGLAELEAAWFDGVKVHVRAKLPSGRTVDGMAVLTEFSQEAPHEDIVTWSGSLEGSGALTDTPAP